MIRFLPLAARVPVAVLLLLMGACGPDPIGNKPRLDAGSTPTDAGDLSDAGDPSDAGEPFDAGETLDAGDPVDAGDAPDGSEDGDAGEEPDAGEPLDAGEAFDAGEPPDAGTAGCPGGCGAHEACCDDTCLDVSEDDENCGGCGLACVRGANVIRACRDGACGAAVCEAGFADCDGDPENGCEASLADDADHCGACGMACTHASVASAGCVESECAVTTCEPGRADCDGLFDNGCEVNVLMDPAHCGGCGDACPVAAGQVARCLGGNRCIAECAPGRDDCDSDPANGCEVDLRADPTNCGFCSNICPDVSVGTPTCVEGSCSGTCHAGWADCSPSDGKVQCAVELARHPMHCGACGNECLYPDAHGICTDNQCRLGACVGATANCDGDDENGCETSTTELTSCGGCGIECALANADPTCATGTCRISRCQGGWGDCDEAPENGCERRVEADPDCGACGRNCSALANTFATCGGSSCVITSCAAGWADCNGDPNDGCEAALNTEANCGACGARPPELANKLDDDCDGVVDEGVPTGVFFTDQGLPSRHFTGAAQGHYEFRDSFCPEGMLAIGQTISATNTTLARFLTDWNLVCAELDFVADTPTKLKARHRTSKDGVDANGNPLSPIGPSTAAMLCPDGYIMNGAHFGWTVDGEYSLHSFSDYVECQELTLVLGTGGWQAQRGPVVNQGPARGWTGLGNSFGSTWCPEASHPIIERALTTWQQTSSLQHYLSGTRVYCSYLNLRY